jgi:uncharacterized protein YhdP
LDARTNVETSPLSAPPAQRWGWARVTLVGLFSAVALFLVVLLAYQLALARVPQHRATLERLVRSQTGLDVRFSELGVRWGWYGPEAVFRHVELGEPGRTRASPSNVLLRAPELTVGFDAWRTMRSGHLEAGRIALVAPDIDLRRVGSEPPAGAALRSRDKGRVAGDQTPAKERARLLERWRDGRIDIEGGSLRLPDPAGSPDPFVLQIRHASVRRAGDEWNLFALVFLPERLGRTARVVMRLDGALDRPASWSGSLRFDGRRLAFAGWREFAGFAPQIARYSPVAGSGDLTVNLDFAHGRIDKADGTVYAGGVALTSPTTSERTLDLDRLRGQWWLVRHPSYWRLRVAGLELGAPPGESEATGSQRAELTIDTAAAGASWMRGKLEGAPLRSVAAIGQWLAPHLDLGGVELGGTARELTFDWDGTRQSGRRLNAAARLSDVSVTPPSHGFVLAGMTARVSGNEDEFRARLQADAARLDLAGVPQYPLEGVRVASELRIARVDEGWQVATQRLELRHESTRLELSGTLSGGGAALQPELAARGKLTGADALWVKRALGSGAARALGHVSASLTGGYIERVEFEMRGPIDELPYGTGNGGTESGSFSGALSLRDVTLAGDDTWPDATGVRARVEWRGSLVKASLDSGRAGPFQLASASAEWHSTGEGGVRAVGQVNTRIEEASAWLQSHPSLDEYAPRVKSVDLQGAARLDFNIGVPGTGSTKARVVATLENARLQWASGAVPIEDLSGAVVFDGGRLQRSTLTGQWLGGPVELRVDERRERGQTVLAMQAQGSMDAQRLAALAAIDAGERLGGSAEWTGDMTFSPANGSQPARWRVRADSTLLGVDSELPEPLDKPVDGTLPLHVDLAGTDSAAQLRVSLSDRLRSVLSLQRSQSGWKVERGAVTFGSGYAALPAEPVVLLQGRVGRLDLPAYLALWQQARVDPRAPRFEAQLVASEMVAAGRSYPEVTLVGQRTDSGVQLSIDSESLAGTAHWPLAGSGSKPAEFHLTRLSVPEPAEPGAAEAVFAAIGSHAQLSIDDLVWEGRRVGRVTATLVSGPNGTALDDVRVSGSTHDGTGSVQCQPSMTSCRAIFTLESSDVAATLEDLGFRPDLSAAKAAFSADVEWQPHSTRAWSATLAGRLSMKLADGVTQVGAAQDGQPFALLSVPALVDAMYPAAEAAAHELRFARLEADFELADGHASTSNLHFDGDAEILMRGRTDLQSRDYDQEVWVLKGEERLPAALRRFAPTPRVAAAWLTLRELFAATGEAPPRALLRLRGSWDDPVVSEAQ